jgi:leucine-rich repeat protein SHOC2
MKKWMCWSLMGLACLAESGRILDFNGQGLAQVPAEVLQSQEVRQLVLNQNQLRQLPAQLEQLRKLEVLWVAGNPLGEVPAVVTRLRLTNLDLSQCQIAALPGAFPGWSRLRQLSLHSNQLKQLPASLAQLPELEVLDVSNNQLTHLPGQGWPKLKVLVVQGNPLEAAAWSVWQSAHPQVAVTF